MHCVRWCALAAPLFLSAPALSAMLVAPRQVTMHPIIERAKEGFDVCGINVTATVMVGENLERHEFLLLTSASTLQGSVKAGRNSLPISKLDVRPIQHQPKLPGPTGFWLAAADQGKAMRTQATRPDDPGYLTGAVLLPAAIDQLEHFVAGKKMQFGIEYAADQPQYAISFSEKMPLPARTDLLACLQGQLETMREKHKDMLQQSKTAP